MLPNRPPDEPEPEVQREPPQEPLNLPTDLPAFFGLMNGMLMNNTQQEYLGHVPQGSCFERNLLIMENKHLKEDAAAGNKRWAEIGTHVKELMKKNENLTAEVGGLRSALEKAKSQCLRLDTELSKTRNENASLQSMLEDLGTEKATSADLELALKEKTKNEDALMNKRAGLENSVAELQKEIAKLTDANESLKASLETERQNCEMAEKNLNKLQESHTKQCRIYDAKLENEKRTSVQKLKNSEDEINDLTSKLDAEKQKAKNAMEQIESYNAAIFNLNKEKWQLNKTIKNLESIRTERNSEVQRLVFEIGKLTEEKKKLDGELCQIRVSNIQEVKMLKAQLETSRDSIRQQAKDLEATKKLIEDYRQKSLALAFNMKIITKENDNLKAENTAIRVELGSHQKQEFPDLNAKIRELEDDLDSEKKEAVAKQKSIDELLNQNSELKEKCHKQQQGWSDEKKTLEEEVRRLADAKKSLDSMLQLDKKKHRDKTIELLSEKIKLTEAFKKLEAKLEEADIDYTVKLSQQTNVVASLEEELERLKSKPQKDWEESSKKMQLLIRERDTLRKSIDEKNLELLDYPATKKENVRLKNLCIKFQEDKESKKKTIAELQRDTFQLSCTIENLKRDLDIRKMEDPSTPRPPKSPSLKREHNNNDDDDAMELPCEKIAKR